MRRHRDTEGTSDKQIGQSVAPSSLHWARALRSHLRALGPRSLAGAGQVKENVLSLWFLRKDQPPTVRMPQRPAEPEARGRSVAAPRDPRRRPRRPRTRCATCADGVPEHGRAEPVLRCRVL